jgi:hypothetical protein
MGFVVTVEYISWRRKEAELGTEEPADDITADCHVLTTADCLSQGDVLDVPQPLQHQFVDDGLLVPHIQP